MIYRFRAHDLQVGAFYAEIIADSHTELQVVIPVRGVLHVAVGNRPNNVMIFLGAVYFQCEGAIQAVAVIYHVSHVDVPSRPLQYEFSHLFTGIEANDQTIARVFLGWRGGPIERLGDLGSLCSRIVLLQSMQYRFCTIPISNQKQRLQSILRHHTALLDLAPRTSSDTTARDRTPHSIVSAVVMCVCVVCVSAPRTLQEENKTRRLFGVWMLLVRVFLLLILPFLFDTPQIMRRDKNPYRITSYSRRG
mmetsp:Transcript_36820/g.90934  ORF Transcript_36820/g.90934 Transcript_36820/m.90934 type:complete len:249 (+) Transcript_36820:1241-1987(+)